jgi:hypothetical protein
MFLALASLPPLPRPCAVYRAPDVRCIYIEPLDTKGQPTKPTIDNPGSYECNKVGEKYRLQRLDRLNGLQE